MKTTICFLTIFFALTTGLWAQVSDRMELKEWQYRWGNSPKDATGFLYLKEDQAGWQPLNLPGYPDNRENNDYLWIRTRLNKGSWKNPALFVPYIYHNFEVYQGTKRIYKFGSVATNQPNEFLGLPWHMIALDKNYSGKILTMRIYSKLAQIGASDVISIGSQAQHLSYILKKDIDRLIFGFLFIFIALFQFFIFIRRKDQKACFYLGGFAFAIGVYTLCWLQIKQLFLYMPLFWVYLEYISLYFLPVFFCFFFVQIFSTDRTKIIYRVGVMHLGYALISLTIASFDPSLWMYTLSSFRLLFLFCIFLLLTMAIIEAIKGDSNARTFTIGFSLLALFSIYDLVGNMGLLPWIRAVSHWGVFVFMISLGIIMERRFTEAHNLLKTYAQDLEEKNQELSRMDKLKDEFLANTSHELRTPLNGIIGIAESMMDGATGKLSGQQLQNLNLVVVSGKRLSNLVNDILDFSKLKHENIQINSKAMDIRTLTDVVFSLSKPLVVKKGIELLNNIPPNVVAVYADEDRIQQVMHNLVGNAIKFTDKGSVEVSTQKVGEHLHITVSDTGIGIAKEKWDSIFESFQQADGSTSREYGGTGLGLTLAKKFIELHGGKIWLDSEPEKGSQFSFSLPLAKDSLEIKIEKKPISKVKPVIESSNKDTAKLALMVEKMSPERETKILIVDDDTINIQVLKNHISLKNYSIVEAQNGAEAIEAIEENPEIDMMLLDIMMPKMSGYGVCQKVRNKIPSQILPIVMLTAKNQTEDVVAAFECGANDYLVKPVAKNELLARVNTHMQLSKINSACERFVPWEFLEFLGHQSIVDVQLGDQIQMESSILFSDIRSFTTLSEQMTPKENFNFINSYLSRMGPIIRDHKGFIDKYIGDAIMALFPQKAEDAVSTGLHMIKEMGAYNIHREKQGYMPIDIGLGIHTGSVMLGMVGEKRRMEGTVIADAVNLAARLEGLTKQYGASILISEQTLNRLEDPDKYAHRFLDRVQVKGKKDHIGIFEILTFGALAEQKTQGQQNFTEALDLYYDKKFEQALKLFTEQSQKIPKDKALKLYVARCQNFIKNGVPENWQGVESWEIK